MISHLAIENFKSIRNLNLSCRKINIFLGEPNTGKSNLLEALGVLSWCGQSARNQENSSLPTGYQKSLPPLPYQSPFSQTTGDLNLPEIQEITSYIRLEKMQNLFWKNQTAIPISISIQAPRTQTIRILMQKDGCMVTHQQGPVKKENERVSAEEKVSDLTVSGKILNEKRRVQEFESIFLYRFADLTQFPDPTNAPLKSPIGQNLFSVVMSDKKCLAIMKDLFASSEFRFVLKPGENKFEFQQEEDNIVYTYPYLISSDTFRHIAFFTIAIASQQNATLIFEEPESHTFPYYTKYLAEQIGFDTTNQFFLVTHNQYLLSTLIEKVPKDQLAVHIVHQQKGETMVTPLTKDQISNSICTDPFFDLESFLEHDE